MKSFAEGQGFSVWPGVFYVTRVNNTGAAFGILKGSALVLTGVSVFCIAGLVFLIIQHFHLESVKIQKSIVPDLKVIALVFVAAGAAGNLVDRLFYGYVIDFIDVRIWPVFNIADSAICVGVFLIMLGLFKTGKVF